MQIFTLRQLDFVAAAIAFWKMLNTEKRSAM